MRPTPEAQLPMGPESEYDKSLNFKLRDIFRSITQRLNALSDGSISAVDNAALVAPTTGSYLQGDVILNRTPSELGTAASKYVIYGWQCVASGTPGAFVQMRYLTGN